MGDISKTGLDFIKRKEGYYSKAYLCPAGVWTLGWGSIRWDAKTPVKKGDVCTLEQAERLLLKEIQRVEDAIDATITWPISQGMYDCLCSIFYNIGIGWLTGQGHQQATLVKYINQGRLDKVPSEILKFKRANGKVIKGLEIRRQEEVRELWFGTYTADDAHVANVVQTDPEESPMPQAVTPAVPSSIEVVKNSGTAKAAGLGIIGTLVQIWTWTFGAVKEAGVEAVGNQQALGPFDALFKALGANVPLLAASVVLGTLIIVIMRKINQERG